MSRTTNIVALFGLLILLALFCYGILFPRSWVWPLGIMGVALFVPYIITSLKKREERLHGGEDPREDYRR